MKRKRPAGPFDALLGVPPPPTANTGSAVLVVAGLRVGNRQDVRAVAAAMSDGPFAAQLEAQRLAAELCRVRSAQRYQREKADPVAMAKRQAWAERNKDKCREAIRRWRAKNMLENREYQKAWAKRRYHEDPQAFCAKQRAYYAANREAVLKRLRDKKARLKAVAQGQAPSLNSQPEPGKQA